MGNRSVFYFLFLQPFLAVTHAEMLRRDSANNAAAAIANQGANRAGQERAAQLEKAKKAQEDKKAAEENNDTATAEQKEIEKRIATLKAYEQGKQQIADQLAAKKSAEQANALKKADPYDSAGMGQQVNPKPPEQNPSNPFKSASTGDSSAMGQKVTPPSPESTSATPASPYSSKATQEAPASLPGGTTLNENPSAPTKLTDQFGNPHYRPDGTQGALKLETAPDGAQRLQTYQPSAAEAPGASDAMKFQGYGSNSSGTIDKAIYSNGSQQATFPVQQHPNGTDFYIPKATSPTLGPATSPGSQLSSPSAANAVTVSQSSPPPATAPSAPPSASTTKRVWVSTGCSSGQCGGYWATVPANEVRQFHRGIVNVERACIQGGCIDLVP